MGHRCRAGRPAGLRGRRGSHAQRRRGHDQRAAGQVPVPGRRRHSPPAPAACHGEPRFSRGSSGRSGRRGRSRMGAGIPVAKLAVLNSNLEAATVPASLPQTAADATAIPPDPYLLTASADGMPPARLAHGAGSRPEGGHRPRRLRRQGTGGPRGARRRSRSARASWSSASATVDARDLPGGTPWLKVIGFAMALFCLWCGVHRRSTPQVVGPLLAARSRALEAGGGLGRDERSPSMLGSGDRAAHRAACRHHTGNDREPRSRWQEIRSPGWARRPRGASNRAAHKCGCCARSGTNQRAASASSTGPSTYSTRRVLPAAIVHRKAGLRVRLVRA